MKQLFLFPFVLLFVLACSHKKQAQQTNSTQEINIRKALDQNSEIDISNFTEGEIEYIPLESKKENLLGNNARFYATETEIIAFARRQIFVFDRGTGKFLREIGHYGKDPAGYKRIQKVVPFDQYRNLIYANPWDNKEFIRYNLNGKFKDKNKVYAIDIENDLKKNLFGEMVTSIAPLNDTCFIGYNWNLNGKQKTKLIVFNENHHRINTFPQTQSFEYDIKKNGMSVFPWEGWFYQFNNELSFYEKFSDTIYTVTPNELTPKFVLENGDIGSPYTKRYLSDYTPDNYYFVENIFESSSYLFFTLKFKKQNHYGFYDKKEMATYVSMENEGIENDRNNFVPFKFYSTNNKEEIIGFLEAYEVKLWFAENPEKEAKLPPHLQKLKNIKETDNPVVMIAKLKQ